MKKIFENDWQKLLEDEMDKDYYKDLRDFLCKEYKERKIFPGPYDIFNALHATSYKDTKLLILGQDPYHGEGQAHGFAFSVGEGVKIPPSLQNIYKELESDLGFKPANHGNLSKWAEQGVLLLNTALTVRAHEANSHRGYGWEIFTDHIIRLLNSKEEPMVFILWGANARSKKKFIKNPLHLIIEAPHPSPLSAYRGFFGSKPFSRSNDFLVSKGLEPIDWEIKDINL